MNAKLTERFLREGAGGYNTTAWRASGVIGYLERYPLETEHPIYSNAPDAIYILAGLEARQAPAKGVHNSPAVINTVAGMRGTWPETGTAYLAWFARNERAYLFDLDELAAIARLEPVAEFEDGAIYRVYRRPGA